MCTHNLCIRAKMRKNVYPCKLKFYNLYKRGINYTGVVKTNLFVMWLFFHIRKCPNILENNMGVF